MDQAGRKRLPQKPPLWLGDISDETYFITICVQDRAIKPLVCGDIPRRLLESIHFYNEKNKWWTDLALIMPDHVHMLTKFPGDLAPTVQSWKHWTSRHVGIEWQRDFSDHRLRRDEKLNERAQYILNNPVRAGLVDDWEKWPHFWMIEGPV